MISARDFRNGSVDICVFFTIDNLRIVCYNKRRKIKMWIFPDALPFSPHSICCVVFLCDFPGRR